MAVPYFTKEVVQKVRLSSFLNTELKQVFRPLWMLADNMKRSGGGSYDNSSIP